MFKFKLWYISASGGHIVGGSRQSDVDRRTNSASGGPIPANSYVTNIAANGLEEELACAAQGRITGFHLWTVH